MTEGIINEIFNPVIDEFEGELHATEFNGEWYANWLTGLKRTLIELLKANTSTIRLDNCVSSREFIYLDKLLGDNSK